EGNPPGPALGDVIDDAVEVPAQADLRRQDVGSSQWQDGKRPIAADLPVVHQAIDDLVDRAVAARGNDHVPGSASDIARLAFGIASASGGQLLQEEAVGAQGLEIGGIAVAPTPAG